MATHVAINYLISKFENAQKYEKFLTEIFRDHVGIKDRVSFQKTSWSSADFNEGNSRFTFFATSIASFKFDVSNANIILLFSFNI